MSGLTPKQHTAFTFIANYIRQHGKAPSFEEMAVALETVKSGVHRLVQGLIERGYVEQDPKRYRSIRIIKAPKAYVPPMPTPEVLSRSSAEDLDQLRRDLSTEISRRTMVTAFDRVDALTEAR